MPPPVADVRRPNRVQFVDALVRDRHPQLCLKSIVVSLSPTFGLLWAKYSVGAIDPTGIWFANLASGKRTASRSTKRPSPANFGGCTVERIPEHSEPIATITAFIHQSFDFEQSIHVECYRI
jgi:hypothetical protein